MRSQTDSGLYLPQDEPVEWHAAKLVATVLNEIAEVVVRQVSSIGAEVCSPAYVPNSDSAYAHDRLLGDDLAAHMFARACDLFILAVDHARLASRALDDHPVKLASVTCSRAVLELCATASWLIDSEQGITSKMRFGRYFDFILNDPVRLRRQYFEISENRFTLGITPEEAEEAYNADIKQIKARATELGIEPIKCGGKPRHPVYSDLSANPTALSNAYFDHGALYYKWYSAAAHGAPWGTESLWHIREVNDTFQVQPHVAHAQFDNTMQWLGKTSIRIYRYVDCDAKSLNTTLEHYKTRIAEIKTMMVPESRYTDSAPVGSSMK